MALSGDDIRLNLSAFASRWQPYSGTERSGAQTFLNELFACYGQDPKDIGAAFEARQGSGFVDLLWPGVCLFEMKAPSEAKRLAQHRPQAMRYWENAADPDRDIPAPTYVVLCAFQKFEIWEPGRFPKAPRRSCR